MSSSVHEDEWVFDTVKPGTVAPIYKTQKRRKASRVLSSGQAGDLEGLLPVMEKLEMNAAPLNIDSPSPIKRKPVPREENQSPRRTSSAATAIRRLSATSVAPSTAVPQDTPTMRRTSAIKEPLALDMSFGNSTSTVRQFRRVSQIHSPVGEEPPQISENTVMGEITGDTRSNRLSCASTAIEDFACGNFHGDGKENTAESRELPPQPEPIPPSQTPTSSPSKLAVLGNRAYKRTIAPALQDVVALVNQKMHAAPSPKLQTQLNAVTRFENAWSEFNAIDPETELLLLKAILDRVQSEKKLAATLGLVPKQPVTPATSDITHCRDRASRRSQVFSDDASSVVASAVTARTSFTPAIHNEENTPTSRNNTPSPTKKPVYSTQLPMDPPKTPSKSPTKPKLVPTPSRQSHTELDKSSSPSKNESPSKRRNSRLSTPSHRTVTPAKLVLAQNNPHLQYHQRRQSAIIPPSSPVPAPLSPRKVRHSDISGKTDTKPEVQVTESEVPPSPPKQQAPARTPPNSADFGVSCSPSKAMSGAMTKDQRTSDVEDGVVRLDGRDGRGMSPMEAEIREKFPGQAVPGLEHVKALGDVLYGRWADGLKGRWGIA